MFVRSVERVGEVPVAFGAAKQDFFQEQRRERLFFQDFRITQGEIVNLWMSRILLSKRQELQEPFFQYYFLFR